jgi:hypothetical protein
MNALRLDAEAEAELALFIGAHAKAGNSFSVHFGRLLHWAGIPDRKS